METLVTMIRTLEASSLKPRQFLEDEDNDMVPLIRHLIHNLFITEDGRLDRKNKEQLENYGYVLYPLEQDSYGWLVGALLTKKGSITFG